MAASSPEPSGHLPRADEAGKGVGRRLPIGRSSRRRWFRALAGIIGLGIGWGSAEAWLALSAPPLRTKRVLVNSRDPSVVYHCYSSNPNGEFQPLPKVTLDWFLMDFMFSPTLLPLEKLDETPYCVELRHTADGIRDTRNYSQPVPAGKLRVAVVGDSFVAGEGVPLELSLPRQLEREGEGGIQFVNAGRSGIGTHEQIEFLRAAVENYSCSRAIVVFIANDVLLTPELDARQKYINDLINVRDEYFNLDQRRAWYRGHSKVLELIGTRMEMGRIERETVQWYLDSYDEGLNGQNLEALRSDLKRIASTPGCRVAFVMYPLMIGLEREYPLQSIHDKVGKLAREAGMPVFDLAGAFRGMSTTRLHAHPTDHHPNGKAHGIAARAILDWLRRDVPGFLDVPPGDQ